MGEACAVGESFQRQKEPFGVRDEPFSYPVVGALGDAEVKAEGRNIWELSGDSGIDEGQEEAKAVGGIGNNNGREQRVGAATRAAFKGTHGYQMVV